MNRFVELFHDHAAASLDKQLALGELLGEHEWTLDVDSGHITFTTGRLLFKKRQSFAFQMLGTESEGTKTWLWAWANERAPTPTPLLQAAHRLKAMGAEEDVPELTDPHPALGTTMTGHHFAMIASGLLGADCYYRASYEGGAAFVLVEDPSFPRLTVDPLARIASVFPRLISCMDIEDHRRSFVSYLRHYDLAAEDEGAVVVCHASAGRLIARFDGERRLAGLTVEA